MASGVYHPCFAPAGCLFPWRNDSDRNALISVEGEQHEGASDEHSAGSNESEQKQKLYKANLFSEALPFFYVYKPNTSAIYADSRVSILDELTGKIGVDSYGIDDCDRLIKELIEAIPSNSEFCQFNYKYIKDGLSNQLKILRSNTNIITAANNPVDRHAHYTKLTNALSYIVEQLLVARREERITEQELLQAGGIMGSAGWNCFTAYLEAIELIGTQYASVLGLDKPKNTSLNGIVASKIELLFRKVFHALSQRLFEGFFERDYKIFHLWGRSEDAMRIHFRQHFHDRINQEYDLSLPVHSYDDSTIDSEALKEDERWYLRQHFEEVFDARKIYELVYEHLNELLSTDHQFYEHVVDWFKRYHNNGQDVVDMLSEEVFDGFSKTLRKSALESLLISTGIVSPVWRSRSDIMRMAFFAEDAGMLIRKNASQEHLTRYCFAYPETASKLYDVAVFKNAYEFANRLSAADASVAEGPVKSLFEHGHFDRLVVLLDTGLSPDFKVGCTHRTAKRTLYWRESILSLAVKNRQLELVKRLLSRNASMQTVDKDLWVYDAVTQKHYRNRSLLHRAIFNNDLDMVKLLVEHGAPLNLVMERFEGRERKSNTFLTPISLSFESKNDEIFYYLLQHKGVNLGGLLKLVYDAGERQLFVDIVERGWTCEETLRKIVNRRDFELLEYLVNRGLSVGPQSAANTHFVSTLKRDEQTYRWSETLLSIAVANKAHGLARSLIRAGAKLDPQEGRGWTYDAAAIKFCMNRSLLHRAVIANDLDMVKLLVAHGAPLNQVMERFSGVAGKNNDFLTPLDLSLDVKHDEITTYLLGLGKDLPIPSRE